MPKQQTTEQTLFDLAILKSTKGEYSFVWWHLIHKIQLECYPIH